MNKEVLQLWEQYKLYVEEQNRPIVEKWQQVEDASFQMRKTEEERLWKEVEDCKKEIKEYEKLPWHKKIFTSAPYSDYMLPFRDYHMNEPLFFPHKDIEPTWEGFLDWQLKQSTDKQADTLTEGMPVNI